MTESILTLAHIMPLEMHVEALKEACTNYLINSSEENLNDLKNRNILLSAKFATGDTPEDLMKILSKVKEREQVENLFKHTS